MLSIGSHSRLAVTAKTTVGIHQKVGPHLYTFNCIRLQDELWKQKKTRPWSLPFTDVRVPNWWTEQTKRKIWVLINRLTIHPSWPSGSIFSFFLRSSREGLGFSLPPHVYCVTRAQIDCHSHAIPKATIIDRIASPHLWYELQGHARCYGTITNRWQKALQMPKKKKKKKKDGFN